MSIPLRPFAWLVSLLLVVAGLAGVASPASAANWSGHWSAVDAGDGTTCAIDGGAVWCWGLNDHGQLGNGSTENSAVPVAVDTTGVLAGLTMAQVSVGTNVTCAIDVAGGGYCWGLGTAGAGSGLLGNGSTSESHVPVAVSTSGALAGAAISQISVGSYHSCAVTAAGAVVCWGLNLYGALGNGGLPGTSSTVPMAVDTSGVLSGLTMSAVSAGEHVTCASNSLDALFCWGRNNLGQLGTGTQPMNSSYPVAVDMSNVPVGNGFTGFGVGKGFVCAVDTDGSVWCWGDDSGGALGNGSGDASSGIPVAVDVTGVLSGRHVVEIGVGELHTCVRSTGLLLSCWGDGASGQLGNGFSAMFQSPSDVVTTGLLASSSPLSISAGSAASCAVLADSSIGCWGSNAFGQLGSAAAVKSEVPVAVGTPDTTPTGLVAAAGNSSATVSWNPPDYDNGSVITGYTASASAVLDSGPYVCSVAAPLVECTIHGLTNGTTYHVTVTAIHANTSTTTSAAVDVTPVTVPSAPLAPTVSAGLERILVSWVPPNTGGTAITGYTATATLTGQAADPSDPTCTTSTQLSCAIVGLTNGASYSLRVRATNAVGVGLDSAATSGTPKGVVRTGTWNQVAASATQTCALDGSGRPWCWGSSYRGDGSVGMTALPTPVLLAPDLAGEVFTSISVGKFGVCGLLQSGGAACWGSSSLGQLGNGTNGGLVVSTVASRVSTGVLPAGRTLTKISAGYAHVCAIDSAYSAWCWGYGAGGRLGNGASLNHNVPVEVSGGHLFTEISAGSQHTCAIDDSSHAWCWGLNDIGQLGAGTTDPTLVPIAVDTTGVLAGRSLVAVASGFQSTCAVDSAGLGYCWGSGAYGQLGNGVSATSSVPVAVTMSGSLSGRTITSLAASSYLFCATDSAGAAQCWGVNDVGQFGSLSPSTSNVPVAVPADTVGAAPLTSIVAGSNHVCAVGSAGRIVCWGEQASGQLGNGVSSGDVQISPQLVRVTPSAPTSVNALVGDRQLNVSWSAVADDGGSAVTGYAVSASPGGPSCHSSEIARACVITGLANGTSYTVSVQAENGVGASSPAASAPATPAGVPTKPATIHLTVGNRQLGVTWSASSPNGSPISAYVAVASPGGATCSSVSTGCTIRGLINGKKYTVSVHSHNARGNSGATSASAVPATVPGLIRTLKAANTKAKKVVITWVVPASNGGAALTRYEVRLSTNGGKSYGRWTSTKTVRSITYRNLRIGTSQRVQVRAVNARGKGKSLTLRFTPRR